MKKTNHAWPPAEKAIGVLLLRDWYANIRLHYATRIMVALIIALATSLFGTVALWERSDQFRYILLTDTGDILPQIPLEEANHKDEYIIDWTIDSITRLYSFDYVNYRDQFQKAKYNLTAQGWKNFEDAMEISGNFNAVLGNQFVTTAVPTGPGRVTKSAEFMGRHAWKVEFPMVISYRSSNKDQHGVQKVTNQHIRMTVTVIRQPEFLNASGLGIRSIVAE